GTHARRVAEPPTWLRHEGAPAPCDRTHHAPRGPPSGRTTGIVRQALVDDAIEETLRYEGPVENATFRFAAEPLEIAGVPIAQGEAVMVGLTAADRDGARFPAPDRFDIRRDARGHLAFGHGIHYCLGAPLARLEARTAVRSLLERAPGLALDGVPGAWLPGPLMRGVRSLPVRW
ncbi:cytochrome P450, partial [Streptomyces sp. NPDC057623]|uniref:cytochrome P450 n=1 Tax=Streptomyces sp. NPDC057623 TaxID=3346187 RepID=UPI0036C6B874